jgi:hypothetical protein
MAASSYTKLRKALDHARAQNASDEDLVNLLVEKALEIPGGVEALKASYRESVQANRTDLSAAIEARLFPASREPAAVRVGKSVKKGDTLEGAIGAALANPSRTTHNIAKVVLGDGSLQIIGSSEIAKARVRDADAQTAAIKKRASKVRSDIHGGGLGGSR